MSDNWIRWATHQEGDKSDTPRTRRLLSGIETVNGITGETGPVYQTYVLLEDYEALQRELAAVTRERDELRAKLAEAEKDARRLSFLHDQCSVNFLFKREDGSSAHILGPTNLRAAIDAAMDAERG